ncbi:Organic solute transporter subunit alpha/Transmembrane protein 184 [Dillenia turbinata]|uniref:Organic solute transporter subunit alpha/Transmembrane protein 184 n=1 Tax=Dillenia turbinata TaxID=194707 RepID=A0AAN8ZKJ7_9MAGN
MKIFSQLLHTTICAWKDLFSTINFGLVQYMILKTFCAFLVLFLELFGVYGDREFKWYYGWVPIHGGGTELQSNVGVVLRCAVL